MYRVSCNLYCFMSHDPVWDDRDDVTVLCTLPVDVDGDGNIAPDTRYATLLLIPVDATLGVVLKSFEYARVYSWQWLTYVWQAD